MHTFLMSPSLEKLGFAAVVGLFVVTPLTAIFLLWLRKRRNHG